MSLANVDLDIFQSSATLRPTGDLDLSSADDVTALVRTALERPGLKELVIDLSGVAFIDSSGTGALVHAHNLADEAGVEIVLLGMQPQVLRIFEISGLAGRFNIPGAGADRC